jgi:hypothetical protein
VANAPQNPFEVELLTTQYTPLLELLLQQTQSKLRGFCTTTGGYVGKMASPVQQIGVLSFKAPSGRYSPIQFQLPNYTRRWVFPTDRDVGVPVDTFDELKTIVDPKGGINMAVVAAANRFFDDLLISAAIGSASTGVDSSSLSTETFDSVNALVADTFGASASTGMTYPKLVEAYRIMQHRQVDLDAERPTVVVGSQQISDLKKQQEVISHDYNEQPVVENGVITSLAGFNIVQSERLNTSSSNSLRNTFAWVKSGLHLGVWKDMIIKIDNRIDLSSQPWQLYAMVSAGATRTQQYKIVQINCADTTGLDPTAP